MVKKKHNFLSRMLRLHKALAKIIFNKNQINILEVEL